MHIIKSCLFTLLLIFSNDRALAQIMSPSERLTVFNDPVWDKMVEKATKANKGIFVDCYATWCGPCKLMDKKVFSDSDVIHALNKNFTFVKVQMDSTKADDEEVRSKYQLAKRIRETFDIQVMPSLLFFSSDGEILHKAVGAKKKDDFLRLIDEATNPNTQYYSLVREFFNRTLDGEGTRRLAMAAKQLKDDSIAASAANAYIRNFLDTASREDLLIKPVKDFISSFYKLIHSSDAVFDSLLLNKTFIHSRFGTSFYPDALLEYIVRREYVIPKLYYGKNLDSVLTFQPNWKLIANNFPSKIDRSFSDKLIQDSKLIFYQVINDWDKVAQIYYENVLKHGLDTEGVGVVSINNFVFDVIVRHIEDRKILFAALDWMELIVSVDPYNSDFLDTYAHLLYKLGRKQHALLWQQKAVNLEARRANKDRRPVNSIYQEGLARMVTNSMSW